MEQFIIKIQYRDGWFNYQIREKKTNDLKVFGCYKNTDFRTAAEVKVEVIKTNPKYFNF